MLATPGWGLGRSLYGSFSTSPRQPPRARTTSESPLSPQAQLGACWSRPLWVPRGALGAPLRRARPPVFLLVWVPVLRVLYTPKEPSAETTWQSAELGSQPRLAVPMGAVNPSLLSPPTGLLTHRGKSVLLLCTEAYTQLEDVLRVHFLISPSKSPTKSKCCHAHSTDEEAEAQSWGETCASSASWRGLPELCPLPGACPPPFAVPCPLILKHSPALSPSLFPERVTQYVLV